jgi:hypothetical protein
METAGGIADRAAAEWASSGLIREGHGTSSDSLFRNHDEPAGRIGLDDGPDDLNSCQDCRDWQVIEQGLRTTFPWVFWGFHGKYKIFI